MQSNDSLFFARGVELIDENKVNSFDSVGYTKIKNRLDLLLINPIEFIKDIVNENIDSGLWDEKAKNIMFRPLRELAEVVIKRKRTGENSVEFKKLKTNLKKLEEEKFKNEKEFLEIDQVIKDQIKISIDDNINKLDYDSASDLKHQQRIETLKKVFDEVNEKTSKAEELENTLGYMKKEIQQLKAEMKTQNEEEKSEKFDKLKKEISDMKNSLSDISEKITQNEQFEENKMNEILLDKLNMIERLSENQRKEVQEREQMLQNQIALQNMTIQQLEDKKKLTEEILKSIEQVLDSSCDKDSWKSENIVSKAKLLQNKLNQSLENQKEIVEIKKYAKELEDMISQINETLSNIDNNEIQKDIEVKMLADSIKERISNQFQFLESKIMEIDEAFAHIQGKEAESGIEISKRVKIIMERIQEQANKNIESEHIKSKNNELEKEIIEIDNSLNILDGKETNNDIELNERIKSIKQTISNLCPTVERGIEIDGEAIYHLSDYSDEEERVENNISTKEKESQVKDNYEELKSIVCSIYQAIYGESFTNDYITNPEKLSEVLQILSETRNQQDVKYKEILSRGIAAEKRFRLFSTLWFAYFLYLALTKRG